MNDDVNFQGNKAMSDSKLPWLVDLLKALRNQAITPKDPRVKRLASMLRQRGIWGRIPRLQKYLVDTWKNGRPKPSRPRKLSKLVKVLRFWKILPPRRSPRPGGAPKTRPLSSQRRRGAVSPGASLRGNGMNG